MEGGPLFLLIVSFWRPSREKGSGVGGEKTGDKRGRGRVKKLGDKKLEKERRRVKEPVKKVFRPLVHYYFHGRREGGREGRREPLACHRQREKGIERERSNKKDFRLCLETLCLSQIPPPSLPLSIHPLAFDIFGAAGRGEWDKNSHWPSRGVRPSQKSLPTHFCQA